MAGLSDDDIDSRMEDEWEPHPSLRAFYRLCGGQTADKLELGLFGW